MIDVALRALVPSPLQVELRGAGAEGAEQFIALLGSYLAAHLQA